MSQHDTFFVDFFRAVLTKTSGTVLLVKEVEKDISVVKILEKIEKI